MNRILLVARQPISRYHVFNSGVLLFAGLLLFLCGCNETETPSTPTGKVVAQVFDYKLYSDQLTDLVPVGTSKDDSLRIVSTYINSWAREMVLVHKAEQNLTQAQKNVQKQLDTYRNSLIIYAYEKELVRQKLDTVVSEQEIATYYDAHPSDFELKDNIIKVVYVKVDKKAPNLAKLRTLYKSERPQDRKELEGWCRQFATNYYLDDNSWLLFDDLLKEIPIETYNKELFLQNNRDVEVADSTSFYFVHIKGFMTRNSRSPLTFERENIRNIILNKRKRELIDSMRDNLYKEALESEKVKINTP
jgi:hypothetical protein